MNRPFFYAVTTIGIRRHPFAAIFGGIALAIVAQSQADHHYATPPEPTAVELHQKAVRLSRWAGYASLQSLLIECRAKRADKRERQQDGRIAEL